MALDNGPNSGSWAAVPVTEWQTRLRASSLVSQSAFEFVELRNAPALMAALASNAFLAILNPYGEWTPVLV